jgi:hypothetical protein
MKYVKSYESFLNESLDLSSVFKRKSTTDSYLDMRDFFRAKLGERYEDDTDKKKKLFDKAKEVTVSIDNIIPNQDYLNKDTVSSYQKLQSKLPLGVMFGKDVVIFDGHHRIAADILNGATEIKMLILKA